MNYNPSIYEINARVWLRRFDSESRRATLKDIPLSYWESLKNKGIDYVWLMGVWQTCHASVENYCFEDDLKRSYSRVLKDWKKEDVIGSPFAIDVYELNPDLGEPEDLLKLKNQLNEIGLKLILDFVSNHFNAESSLLKSKPEIFLNASEQNYRNDEHTFFEAADGRIFAHGRDPFFPAWQDTVQINYFNPAARKFMTETLINLSKVCDGVRCDMAILALNNILSGTWAGVVCKDGLGKVDGEFWREAIEKTKNVRNDFLFIGEAYWNLEWELQKLGFDYTYDKILTDRLRAGNVKEIRGHLLADKNYQLKSVRFIENHDEERAVQSLGKERSKAAAVIISTIQGMRFYNDGQFEGKKVKLPLQLGREPVNEKIPSLSVFYEKLLAITEEEIFKEGRWSLLSTLSSWQGNETYKNMLAWEWKMNGQNRLIAVNYSAVVSTCRVKFDVEGFPEEFIIKDLLNEQKYIRSAEEVCHAGLYIELKPFQSHIFAY